MGAGMGTGAGGGGGIGCAICAGPVLPNRLRAADRSCGEALVVHGHGTISGCHDYQEHREHDGGSEVVLEEALGEGGKDHGDATVKKEALIASARWQLLERAPNVAEHAGEPPT